jgi:hypothetical protein
MLAKIFLHLITITKDRVFRAGAQIPVSLNVKMGLPNLHLKTHSLIQPNAVAISLSLINVVDRLHGADQTTSSR